MVVAAVDGAAEKKKFRSDESGREDRSPLVCEKVSYLVGQDRSSLRLVITLLGGGGGSMFDNK